MGRNQNIPEEDQQTPIEPSAADYLGDALGRMTHDIGQAIQRRRREGTTTNREYQEGGIAGLLIYFAEWIRNKKRTRKNQKKMAEYLHEKSDETNKELLRILGIARVNPVANLYQIVEEVDDISSILVVIGMNFSAPYDPKYYEVEGDDTLFRYPIGSGPTHTSLRYRNLITLVDAIDRGTVTLSDEGTVQIPFLRVLDGLESIINVSSGNTKLPNIRSGQKKQPQCITYHLHGTQGHYSRLLLSDLLTFLVADFFSVTGDFPQKIDDYFANQITYTRRQNLMRYISPDGHSINATRLRRAVTLSYLLLRFRPYEEKGAFALDMPRQLLQNLRYLYNGIQDRDMSKIPIKRRQGLRETEERLQQSDADLTSDYAERTLSELYREAQTVWERFHFMRCSGLASIFSPIRSDKFDFYLLGSTPASKDYPAHEKMLPYNISFAIGGEGACMVFSLPGKDKKNRNQQNSAPSRRLSILHIEEDTSPEKLKHLCQTYGGLLLVYDPGRGGYYAVSPFTRTEHSAEPFPTTLSDYLPLDVLEACFDLIYLSRIDKSIDGPLFIHAPEYAFPQCLSDEMEKWTVDGLTHTDHFVNQLGISDMKRISYP
ncbi:hypothetical protein JW930_01470 [Candidatus Woesearchaeota archaeon]|nr:hypothetical protein [Candidatus Woesearchaeota archaeon]